MGVICRNNVGAAGRPEGTGTEVGDRRELKETEQPKGTNQNGTNRLASRGWHHMAVRLQRRVHSGWKGCRGSGRRGRSGDGDTGADRGGDVGHGEREVGHGEAGVVRWRRRAVQKEVTGVHSGRRRADMAGRVRAGARWVR